MGYKVIRFFTDLQDNDYAYKTGDKFPRDGVQVSPARVAELSGSNNKQGVPLITFVKDEKKPEKKLADKKTVEYSKAEISKFSAQKLRDFGTKIGVKDVDDKTASELKKEIIELLKL